MKITRNLLAILALTSFAFAFAEDTGKKPMHHETPAAESKETMSCNQCKGCSKEVKRPPSSPKVRETGPVMTDYMS
jgi:hypothetical protein